MTARTKREKEVRAIALKEILVARRWRSPSETVVQELDVVVDRLRMRACVWLRSPASSSEITVARKFADAAHLVDELRTSIERKSRERRERAALAHLTAPREGMAR